MVVTLRALTIILWYVTCILSCIDTWQFVYPSLSRTLCPTICMMLMAITYIIQCAWCSKMMPLGKIQTFILAWVAYILIHGFMIADAELYQQMYFLTTLLFMIVLTSMVNDGAISKRHLVNGIILIASIHIVYLVCQYFGLVGSHNPYFKLTGSDENPNITAIALTISIPFVFYKILAKKHTCMMATLLAMTFIFLIILRCRTAFVGICCMLLFIAYKSGMIRIYSTGSHKLKIAAIVCLVFVCSVLAIVCYTWKKDSADGRIFIWQRSMEMVASSPFGIGYGLFERNYNLYQSEYFATNEQECAASTLSTACGSAYNDVLEHGVQGGIIGSLMYAGVLLVLLKQAYSMRKWYSLCALLAITVMSLVNSICYSVSPWIMTIAIVALVAHDSPISENSKKFNVICFFVLSCLSLSFLYNRLSFTYTQRLLKEYRDTHGHDIPKAICLFPAIGTSEAYWRYVAECYESEGNSKTAAVCYGKALQYTSSPLLLHKAAMCKEDAGDNASATELLKTACYMLPRNFSLKYHLMKMYDRTGYKAEAKAVACEIMRIPTKQISESVAFIKKEAETILYKQKDTNAH